MTDELIAHLKKQEGLRLIVYRCPAGYPTIGYGHVVPSMNVPAITPARAELLLREDIAKAEDAARRLAPQLDRYPRRFAALTDLVFNIGAGALDGDDPDSPLDDAGVIKALRREDWKDAAARFRRYCHIRDPKTKDVKELPALVARRDVGARWIEEG